VWLAGYPGPSSPRSLVRGCSLISSLLLVRATISQKPSLRQLGRFVRRALTVYTRWVFSTFSAFLRIAQQQIACRLDHGRHTRSARPRPGEASKVDCPRCAAATALDPPSRDAFGVALATAALLAARWRWRRRSLLNGRTVAASKPAWQQP
jgi:hypothetical protein